MHVGRRNSRIPSMTSISCCLTAGEWKLVILVGSAATQAHSVCYLKKEQNTKGVNCDLELQTERASLTDDSRLKHTRTCHQRKTQEQDVFEWNLRRLPSPTQTAP